jgi:hypothetical protein
MGKGFAKKQATVVNSVSKTSEEFSLDTDEKNKSKKIPYLYTPIYT